MKILVCDSDTSSRSVVKRLLQLASSCEVEECATGAESIEILSRGGFDALLIETVLPVLDGFETVALIRASRQLRTLPVVFITNDRTRESVLQGVELSVADYVLKPIRLHRLQSALRAIGEKAMSGGRMLSAPMPVTIDERTRAIVIDGDVDFREFVRSLLSPYCSVTVAASGAAALNEAWASVPSLAFIGRDLGPIGPAALVRFLARIGTQRFVKLAHADEFDEERKTGLYADVIGRTMVASTLLRDLKKFITTQGGPMQQLLEHVPDLRSIVVKATAATFQMMLGLELDVVEAGDTDVVGAHALVTMTVGDTEVRVEIQCATALVRELATATLGADADVQTSVAVLGEIANIITGKLQATTMERGVKSVCSLPACGLGSAPPSEDRPEADQLLVELSPVGRTDRFRVKLDVYARAGADAERLSA